MDLLLAELVVLQTSLRASQELVALLVAVVDVELAMELVVAALVLAAPLLALDRQETLLLRSTINESSYFAYRAKRYRLPRSLGQ
jgi:hypothetical protein